jgi:hypothetical protein
MWTYAVIEFVKVIAGEHSMLDVVSCRLDGDARRRWSGESARASVWSGWLTQDIPGAAVWSPGHDAASSDRLGRAMPMPGSGNQRACPAGYQWVGQRSPCFIAHWAGIRMGRTGLKRSR